MYREDTTISDPLEHGARDWGICQVKPLAAGQLKRHGHGIDQANSAPVNLELTWPDVALGQRAAKQTTWVSALRSSLWDNHCDN